MYKFSSGEPSGFQAKWLGFRGGSQRRVWSYDSGPVSVLEAVELYRRTLRGKRWWVGRWLARLRWRFRGRP